MKILNFRYLIQFLSFGFLTYGGYLGIRIGNFLPCFSCPFVGTCAGNCYLLALQGSVWGFQITFSELISFKGLKMFWLFFLFAISVLILSKIWCGWICPFGTLQDWISSVRKKLGIRKSKFSWGFRNKLKYVKYILLVFLIIIPILIANVGLYPDFSLPFCKICPARIIMPIFANNFSYFSVDITNSITIFMTVLSIIIAAVFLVGIFFIDRFFCIFCPLLALISIFDKIGFVRLDKNSDNCSGCGNCQRVCPMNIREVYLEKENKNVLTQDCILCLKCVESCPNDNVISLKFLKKQIFSSSRKYILKYFVKE